MGYIPRHALSGLRNYRYRGVDKSFLSNYVLNPFWSWFVTLWPVWVAPNMITLSGLSIVLFNFATLAYYDPMYLTEKGGATGPPNWVYFTYVLGIIFTLKQARRTGMAGPLGEMFDHGCDALNTTLECILACHALNLGRSWWTFASQVGTLANFYLTTWEEYHTGQLYLGVFSGPVEGILAIVAMFMITGFYGPTFWDQKILTFTRLENVEWIASRVPNIAMNVSFMFLSGFVLALNIVTSYFNVFMARRESGGPVIKPLLYLLPFPASVLLHVAWLNHPSLSNSDIINSPAFVPFLCTWGLQFAHVVGRMILAHVTSQPFPLWDSMYIWTIIGAVDANMPVLIGRPPLIQNSPVNTEKFVFVILAVAIVTYARFVVMVISDITNYLGIACLTERTPAEVEWEKVLISRFRYV
ncbi:Choline/ethanolaminephosphotransferase [Multifurca ochricompacta]|uniref:Choline/ethanolaminephosphotransferase n=1 Tax=Multifurca ochricompacta TaxID=376703 RepID=A0AAD4MDH4_9AGAM|nr:Choline/ethanolaminephosphotransferase [Multifurca ochricompacta]